MPTVRGRARAVVGHRIRRAARREKRNRLARKIAFDAAYDPLIDKVLIIEATAELMAPGKKGYPRVVRTLPEAEGRTPGNEGRG